MEDATLAATVFVDKDDPFVRDYVARHAGTGGARDKAVNLYYAVRDAVAYDMRAFALDEALFVASNALRAKSAFCVPKAVALAAVARAAGIPSRIGFANVRNHLTSPRIAALMDDDLFRWHAYTSLLLDGRWVKATPAFDIGLCERHGVKPLDFDGRADSIFHPFDREGRQHMDYVAFAGEFDDMPHAAFCAQMRQHHPRLLAGMEQDRHEQDRRRAEAGRG